MAIFIPSYSVQWLQKISSADHIFIIFFYYWIVSCQFFLVQFPIRGGNREIQKFWFSKKVIKSHKTGLMLLAMCLRCYTYQKHVLCSTCSENQSTNMHLDYDHIIHIIWRKFMERILMGVWMKGWEKEWQREEGRGVEIDWWGKGERAQWEANSHHALLQLCHWNWLSDPYAYGSFCICKNSEG